MGDELTAEERAERDAEIGRDAANVILQLMQGVPVSIAYNIIGNITVSIFTAVPFVEPGAALEEFDHWAAYTRQMIADQIKERLQ
ncbi:hypothetical protein QIH77_07735 [Bradyrhizobium diazoefficiens]|uniref:hypothetical protein n=1 Tax=Bradyrhizobium diazoefficiens TaxID=1355477 RepID=UPI002729A988|nr:hypothetical protein [Bradyrhizobium diazoefficiens]WLA75080.1 hypothetical protein QIH77_07735 [Bradyrhizobium diazoefficiens]